MKFIIITLLQVITVKSYNQTGGQIAAVVINNSDTTKLYNVNNDSVKISVFPHPKHANK